MIPHPVKAGVLVFVLAHAGTMVACSASDDGAEPPPDQGSGDPATVWKKLQGLEMTAVSSGIYETDSAATAAGLDDFYTTPSEPVCVDEWIDWDCDGKFPHAPSDDDCPDPMRMDFDAESACPVCVEPPDVERSCAEVQRRYLEFLDHNLRETCTNWCETDSDCSAAEITACGLTHAVALRALVDEEPMGFAQSFAADNCGPCNSNSTEGSELASAELLAFAQPVCREHQCVLVALDETDDTAP